MPVAPQKPRAASTAPVGPVRKPRRPPKPTGPLIESAGPEPDTPLDQVYLTIGIITGTHGISGELKVRPVTDIPEQFEQLVSVYVGDEPRPRKVQHTRFHSGNVLLKLRGISNPEDAATFRGQSVRISGKDALPLEDGEYLLYQLIGLDVFDETGMQLGSTVDLIETGARDVFVIRPAGDGADILLANTAETILEIDPARRRMVVRLQEYL